jgi:hypothetical protein
MDRGFFFAYLPVSHFEAVRRSRSIVEPTATPFKFPCLIECYTQLLAPEPASQRRPVLVWAPSLHLDRLSQRRDCSAVGSDKEYGDGHSIP